ncbi:hypothetical protein DW996_05040 [Roseburia sp. AM51-8]|uniref:hypothetical protein n=1 Tax=Roseburia sp. AM51-8 TaxID=2292366 RepID=UPI000E536A98|nr:hypothetical protein [Roseburia sp. AM51-8]RHQ01160.1 hypothetical protein DW996_05040 [Roseburia sp. AM51-8]
MAGKISGSRGLDRAGTFGFTGPAFADLYHSLFTFCKKCEQAAGQIQVYVQDVLGDYEETGEAAEKKPLATGEDPIIRGKKEETDAMTPAEQEALLQEMLGNLLG